MNFPRFLSFAIPAAIIVFAVLGNAATSTAERGWTIALLIWLGVGLGAALLVLAATIYGLENLT
jgi:hypothetical protein